MQRRTGSAKYARLRDYEEESCETRGSKKPDFLPGQFRCLNDEDSKVPWKAILLATLLFLLGSVLLAAGCLIHTGHMDNDKYGDRLWSLIILGSLMFIPGVYHLHIAVKAFFGYHGYSFDQIPTVD